MDIHNESKKNSGERLQINDENNAISQRFNLQYGEDGYYTIINKNSGKVIDIQNGNKEAGAYIWQYENNNTSAQKWILKDLGNGYYNIISKLNGLYLTVEGSSTNNGTRLIMSNPNNRNNQKFKITDTIYETPQPDALEDGNISNCIKK